MMNKLRSLLGITVFCLFLPTAGPGDAWAVPVGDDGCEVNAIGEYCSFGPLPFYVTDVAPLPNGDPSPLQGKLFGEVEFAIEAIATDLWEYRYQVWMTDDPTTDIDDSFQLTKFRLNFNPPVPLFDENGTNNFPNINFISCGSTVDCIEPSEGGGGFAVTLGVVPPAFAAAVSYNVVFDVPPILKGQHSAVLRLQSPLGPTSQDAKISGNENFTNAFFTNIELIGLGSGELTANFNAPAVVPEPSTILLLGSGLLVVLAGKRFRRRS